MEQANLFTRSDTFFGVCEAIGQDFRFHPNLLRLPLGVLVLWNPVAVLAVYAALGAAVALSRWLYPAPAEPTAAAPEPAVEPAVLVEAEPELLAA